MIERALRRIERGLDADLSLGALARHCGASPHHFQRAFSAAVGESPKQYVRRLRLERAAVQLKHSRTPIAALALGAGYCSHEAFTRAFGARFGVAPQEFRSAALARMEPPRRRPWLAILPSRRAGFVRRVGPYDGLDAAFASLEDWARESRAAASGRFGVFRDDQDITAAARTRARAALWVDETAEGKGDIEVCRPRGGPCAVFEHDGAPDERRRLYAWVYAEWLPARGLRPAPLPPFEVYSSAAPTLVHVPLAT